MGRITAALIGKAEALIKAWSRKAPLVKVALVLAALAIFDTPASAQDMSQVAALPVPHVAFSDENHMDYWSGNIQWPMGSLSIGPQNAAHKFEFNATWSGSIFTHNFLCYADAWVHPGWGGHMSGNILGVQVFCNGHSTEFRTATGGYVNATTGGFGETLVPVVGSTSQDDLIYTDRDGVVTRFSRPNCLDPNTVMGATLGYFNFYGNQLPQFSTSGSPKRNLWIGTSTTHPDGYSLNYSYNCYYGSITTTNPNSVTGYTIPILQSVNSSNGYQFQFNYLSNFPQVNGFQGTVPYFYNYTVKAINNAVEYCSPTATSCALTNTWPSLTYGPNATGLPSGALMQFQQADSLGNVSKYILSAPTYVNPTWPTASLILTSIVSPTGQNNVSFVNGWYNQPTSISRNGVTWTYTWLNIPSSVTGPTTVNGVIQDIGYQKVSIAKPTGENFSYSTQGSVAGTGDDYEFVTSVADAAGNTTTYTPTYCSGQPLAVTYPEGNQLALTFDGRCNVTQEQMVPKPGSASSVTAITRNAGYDASCTQASKCNKPNWVQDALGNETEYTYDATTGLPTSMTSAALKIGSASVRPQVRYTYTPMQAYYLNAASNIVASGVPIQMQTGTSQCQTLAGAALSGTAGQGPFTLGGTPACSGQADELKSTTGFGAQTAGSANNLAPVSQTAASGDGSLSETVSMTYDMIGNVVSQTDAGGNTSYATWDLLRRKVYEISADPDGTGPLPRQVVHHVYDAEGNEVRTEWGTGFKTDGSDFVLVKHKEMTFDPNTGQLIQTREVAP